MDRADCAALCRHSASRSSLRPSWFLSGHRHCRHPDNCTDGCHARHRAGIATFTQIPRRKRIDVGPRITFKKRRCSRDARGRIRAQPVQSVGGPCWPVSKPRSMMLRPVSALTVLALVACMQKCHDLSSRYWARHQEPLDVVTSQRLQSISLLVGFDPFGRCL